MIAKNVPVAVIAGLMLLGVLAGQQEQHAFADGFFQENVQGNIAGRSVQLFVKINPPILTSETQQDAFVQLRLFEGNNQTIKFTTFVIRISKVAGSGEVVLMSPDAFHTESGLLTLKVQPQEGKVQVLGTREDYLQAWRADPGGTVNIRGPILLDSGLYHFSIDVIGVDSVRELLPPDQVRTFDTYLSVGDVVTQDVQYEDEAYPTTIISYYDKVQNFTFKPDSKTFSWSMPFSWDMERIQSAPNIFVHEEIRIPKSLAGEQTITAFDAWINGNPIGRELIALDPYSSEEDLTLHFLISKKDIISLAQQVPPSTETMDFAFSPASDGGEQTSGKITSDTGGMLIQLNWTPAQLGANEELTLDLEFYDPFSGDRITDDVTYDLRMFDPEGNEVYSTTDQVAEGGSDSQTMAFPRDATYRFEVEVKGVTVDGQSSPDLSRNGIALGTVVVPEFGAILLPVLLAAVLGTTAAYSRIKR